MKLLIFKEIFKFLGKYAFIHRPSCHNKWKEFMFSCIFCIVIVCVVKYHSFSTHNFILKSRTYAKAIICYLFFKKFQAKNQDQWLYWFQLLQFDCFPPFFREKFCMTNCVFSLSHPAPSEPSSLRARPWTSRCDGTRPDSPLAPRSLPPLTARPPATHLDPPLLPCPWRLSWQTCYDGPKWTSRSWRRKRGGRGERGEGGI